MLSSSVCAWTSVAKIWKGSLNPGSDAGPVLRPCSDGGGETGRFCDSELDSGVASMRSGLPRRLVRELLARRGSDCAEGIDGERPISEPCISLHSRACAQMTYPYYFL